MTLSHGPKITTNGLVFAYDMSDQFISKSWKGEPTTNLIPTPSVNARFNTGNGWGTLNVNQYNSNNYFSIGTIASVSGNLITTTTPHPLRTFDAVTPQTTGGGVTAGVNYFVKKVSDTSFTLHAYNSSQDGSQGYIIPGSGGYHKVHESIATDTRIAVNSTNFPTMWWGPPHIPNSGLVKEIVQGGGRFKGTNAMRLHATRAVGVDGMAYGVYTPATVGDQVYVSYWAKTNNPGISLSYQMYQGPGQPGYSRNDTITEDWQYFSHTWTASNTFNFYQYWVLSDSTGPYWIDLADLQAEVNTSSGSTPFTLSSRSNTQALLDWAGNNTITANSLTYNNDGTFSFNGSSDYLSATVSLNLYCMDFWIYNNNAIPGNDGSIGGPTTYQSMIGFNNQSTIGVNLGGWTSGATNEAIHIWSGDGTSLTGMTYTRDTVPVGWHNVVFNWNGTTYDIWVDGIKSTVYASTSGHATLQTITNFVVGKNVQSNYFFNGKIATLKMYEQQLSDSEIQQNFQAHRERYGV